MKPTTTGLLLAGGRSSRMGQEKAVLTIGEQPMIRRVAQVLASCCDEILLALRPASPADPGPERLAELCGIDEIRVVHDKAEDRGPVAGLAAGLAAARGEIVFAAACDLPFLRRALVRGLCAALRQNTTIDLVVPEVDGRLQPLLAAYRRTRMATHYERQLERGGGSPMQDLAGIGVLVLGAAELEPWDPTLESFRNINDEADLRAARRQVSQTDTTGSAS